MRVAVDTNVLAYAEGLNDGDRRRTAAVLLDRLSILGRLHIPVQTLGELYRVLRRKAGKSAETAAGLIAFWSQAGAMLPTSALAFTTAVQLAAANRLDIWDAVILAAAIEGECDVLMSEDMQDGFAWGGCTIVNPFARERHPLLEAALASHQGGSDA